MCSCQCVSVCAYKFGVHAHVYMHTHIYACLGVIECMFVLSDFGWKLDVQLVDIQLMIYFTLILTTCTWPCGQVILVVNDEARNNLPEELGLGLVLTIYEAKGLEFDDVLLYNFFKDSEVRVWRCRLQLLQRLEVRVWWCPPVQLLQWLEVSVWRCPLQLLQRSEVRVWWPPLKYRNESLMASSWTTSSRIRGESLRTSSSTTSSVIQRWVWWRPPLQFRGESWRRPLQLLQGSEVRVWWCPLLTLLQGFRSESLMTSFSTTSSRIQRWEFNDGFLYNFSKDSEVRVWWCLPLQLFQGFRGESLVCGAFEWGCSSAGSVQGGSFLPWFIFSTDSLKDMVSMQTFSAIAWTNVCVHFKNPSISSCTLYHCLKTSPFTKQ